MLKKNPNKLNSRKLQVLQKEEIDNTIKNKKNRC